MSRNFFHGLVVILLMLGMLAAAPIDHIDALIAKWEAYNKEYPQVRVHLVFNQPKYALGDTAFFKAYFLLEDYRPVADKQILTLELKDKSGNNVQAQNFRVINGEGSNQVIFPDNMTPGVYTIIVYSEWMKNFDPALFYRKELVISGRKQLVNEVVAQDSLSFYSEGGRMIEGIQNRVIVRSTRKGTGRLMDQSGNVIDEFQIDNHGMADFMFLPQKGVGYYGMLVGEAKKFRISIVESGCVLRVTPQGSAGVELFVAADPASSLGKQDIYFIALSKGRVTNSSTIKLENGTTTISVNNLHPGLNQFYLFDSNDNIVAERIYYVQPASANASIITTQAMVAPRELVSAEVSITDEGNRSLGGSFAVRAIADNLFPDDRSASFETTLNFFNDLPGLKKDFEISGLSESDWLSRLDDRLITQRWLRINWKEVITPSSDKLKHAFEYSLSLKGKGVLMPSGEPAPDSTLVVIYQQKAMVGYETFTTHNGEVTFPFLYDFFGTDHIFYMMEFKQKQTAYQIVPELIINADTSTPSKETDEVDLYGEYKFKKKLIDKSFAFFATPDKAIEAKTINPNVEFEDELGGADVTIKVDDYLVFPTMPDLIHEVITGLQTRQANGTATVRVVFIRNTYTVIPKGDPLYIIDGIFTKNTAFFLSLNPEDIYVIKLVNAESKLQRFGGLGKYGIVIVQTKKSIAKQVIESSTMFPLSGLSNELTYKTPIYSGASSSQKPDLRSSLYWNAKINAVSNGKAAVKFYGSDDASPVTIEVMGITNDGRAFSSKKTIQVKAPMIRP